MAAPDTIDQTQLSPQIRELIQQEIAKARAADQAGAAPKELTPEEKVDAALKRVDATLGWERPGPGHNDATLGAIVEYLHALADRDAAKVKATAESGETERAQTDAT